MNECEDTRCLGSGYAFFSHYTRPTSANSIHPLLLPVNPQLTTHRPFSCLNRKHVLASESRAVAVTTFQSRLMLCTYASSPCLAFQFLSVFCFLNITWTFLSRPGPRICLDTQLASGSMFETGHELVYMSQPLTIDRLSVPNLDPSAQFSFLTYIQVPSFVILSYICPCSSTVAHGQCVKIMKEKTQREKY